MLILISAQHIDLPMMTKIFSFSELTLTTALVYFYGKALTQIYQTFQALLLLWQRVVTVTGR